MGFSGFRASRTATPSQTVSGDASLKGSVTINDDAADEDFRVESDNETHMLFLDGGNNRVSIGDSADAPAATLEVTNHATAGAFDVPLFQLNSNDVNQIALDINAANTLLMLLLVL